MKTRHLASERGFTLAELLVATAIVGIVMSGLWVMLNTGQEAYLVGSNQVESQQSLRLAVDRMVQDIRNAGYCPTCTATSTCATIFAPITGPGGALSATTFTIQYDWNGNYNCGTGTGIATSGTVTYTVSNPDGTVSTTNRGEQVIYAVTGGQLTRREIGVDASPVVIVGGVSSASFTYQDAAGATTATPANVRRVVITITAQPQFQPSATQQGRALVTVQDTVRLRNRVN